MTTNHFFNMVTGNPKTATDSDRVTDEASEASIAKEISNPGHNASEQDVAEHYAQHHAQPYAEYCIDDQSLEADTELTIDLNTDLATESTSATDQMPDVMSDTAKRVLVHLMRHGVIFHAQKPNLFTELCQHQAPIRRHLSEVYLNLVLDERQGVAFIARPDSDIIGQTDNNSDSVHPNTEEAKYSSDLALEADDDNAPSLITKRSLSLFDTLILLVLRKYYQEREASGEQKIIIDIERLASLLTPFLPLTDHASKDQRKLVGRLNDLSRRHLLSSVRGSDERYEITPLIRYVVNADFLESMLSEYLRLVQETTGEHINEGVNKAIDESADVDSDDTDEVEFNDAADAADLASNDAADANRAANALSANPALSRATPENLQSDLFGE